MTKKATFIVLTADEVTKIFIGDKSDATFSCIFDTEGKLSGCQVITQIPGGYEVEEWDKQEMDNAIFESRTTKANGGGRTITYSLDGQKLKDVTLRSGANLAIKGLEE